MTVHTQPEACMLYAQDNAEVWLARPGDALCQRLEEFARHSDWVAGPHLADMLKANRFADWAAPFALMTGGEIIGQQHRFQADIFACKILLCLYLFKFKSVSITENKGIFSQRIHISLFAFFKNFARQHINNNRVVQFFHRVLDNFATIVNFFILNGTRQPISHTRFAVMFKEHR